MYFTTTHKPHFYNWLLDIKEPSCKQYNYSFSNPIKVNLYEGPTEYLVLVNPIGITAEDIDITLENSHIDIKETSGEKYGKRIELKNPIEPDSINARVVDGMIHISIQKKEQAEAKKITIES